MSNEKKVNKIEGFQKFGKKKFGKNQISNS